MRTILEFKKDILLGVFLFLTPLFLPPFGLGGDVSTLVGATTSVFAIVAGFFIADAMSNYLRLQTLIAEENAALISIADNAKKVDGTKSKSVHHAIDEYMIAQLDFGALNHVFHTEKQVDQIGTAIDSLEVKDEGRDFFDHILSMKEKVFACRQEIALAAKRNLMVGHWTILIMLAVLVATTVLATQDGGLFMKLVAGLMIVGMQGILILLREVDSNHLLEKKLAYENPREVFHAISESPYYPFFSPVHSRVPNEAGIYRLGKEVGSQGESYDIVKVSK